MAARVRFCLVLATATALALPATRTAGAEPTAEVEVMAVKLVTVPTVEGLGSFPPTDRERLDARLREGIARAGFDVARRGSADATIKTTVRKSEGDYHVTAEVERNGEVAFTVEETCELCGVDELGETLASLGSQIRRRTARLGETARLRVSSSPEGAEVRLDGELIGATPVEADVPAGNYEMTVEQAGYRAEETSVALEPGARADYSLTLRRQGYKNWLPWVLIGTGAASLAAGVSLIAIHEDPIRRDCNPDIDGRCQYLYDTLGGGVTLTVAAAGMLVSGITLAVLWRRDRPQERLAHRLRPAPGGLALRF